MSRGRLHRAVPLVFPTQQPRLLLVSAVLCECARHKFAARSRRVLIHTAMLALAARCGVILRGSAARAAAALRTSPVLSPPGGQVYSPPDS